VKVRNEVTIDRAPPRWEDLDVIDGQYRTVRESEPDSA
jgi:hypothetical protein